ncbi:MAG: right-handed parallel beta-helix repeat-containing protein [Clostridia bacterium]|nr:right-handed parallel beta-helix repeat-containing protein [Clostridia bacterium]
MIYDPIQYGAKADGKTNDAAAIQAAIDAAHIAGGGTVLFRSGKAYKSASLFLKSHVTVHLENGSQLIASERLEDYYRPNQPAASGPVSTVGTPVTGKPSYVFLYAYDAEHVHVTGEGTIDGCGSAFVRRISQYYVTGDFYPRPTLIYFENCRHITFRDCTLQNVAFWTLHVAGCQDVLIDALRILNPLDVANSDGIDVDHSQYVRIRDCHVECADDCICMKNTMGNREYPHTQGVIVSGCTLISTSSALKIGTEGVDDFEDILFTDCFIDKSNRGLSIQIRDGGNVRNITFSNINIKTRRFSPDWWGTAEPIVITAVDRDTDIPCGSIERVRFFNISCEGENGALLYGLPGHIQDIFMEHVRIRLVESSKWPKHLVDLRPGKDMGIVSHETVPLLTHNIGSLYLDDVQLLSVTGEEMETEEI